MFADGKSGLNGPYGMATDRLNNLYVANSEAWELLRFDPSGNVLVLDKGTEDVTPGLRWPTGVTYNKINNKLYVCNYGAPFGMTNMAIPIYNEPVQSIKVYQIVYDYDYLGELSGVTYTIPFPYTNSAGDVERNYFFFALTTDLDGKVYTSMAAVKPDVFVQQGFDCIIKSVYDVYTPSITVGKFYGGVYNINLNNYVQAYYINRVTDTLISSDHKTLYICQYSSPFPDDTVDTEFPPYPYGVVWKVNLNDPELIPILIYPTFVGTTDLYQAMGPGSNNEEFPFPSDETVYYMGKGQPTMGAGVNAMASTGLVRKIGYSQVPNAQLFAGIGLKTDSVGNVYYLMQFVDPDGGDTSPLYKFNRIGDYTFSTITNMPIYMGDQTVFGNDITQFTVSKDDAFIYYNLGQDIYKFTISDSSYVKIFDSTADSQYDSLIGATTFFVDNNSNFYAAITDNNTTTVQWFVWDSNNNRTAVTITNAATNTFNWLGVTDIASNNTSFINYVKSGESTGSVFRVEWTNSTTATATELSPDGVALDTPGQIAVSPDGSLAYIGNNPFTGFQDGKVQAIVKYTVATNTSVNFSRVVNFDTHMKNPTSMIYEPGTETHVYTSNSVENNLLRIAVNGDTEGTIENVTVNNVTLAGPTGMI